GARGGGAAKSPRRSGARARRRDPRARRGPVGARRPRRARGGVGAGQMKVTALITAYNCERFIGEAVDSALAQDYDGPLEVLVIDDGSTDATAAALEARRDAARACGAAVRDMRVIRQPNAGGIAEATGELIALLDADDAWPPDKLRRQIAALGDAGLIYGDMTVFDAGGAVIDESWLGDAPAPQTLADWLRGNAATSSSIVMRT